MTREIIRQIERDYWAEKADPIDMSEIFDLAQKALEQESNCSEIPTGSTTKNDLGVDCIDRKKLIDWINIWDITPIIKNPLIRHIQAMPSVTPQEPRWIPVSEKLPNDRDWYLGIFKEPDTGWINPLPFICDYVGRETKTTTKDYWCLRGFTDWDDYHIDYYFNLECVAWMPLPEPFEPQESEK